MKGAFLAVLILAVTAAAQTSYPPPAPGRQTAAPAQPAPDQLLVQVEQTAANINATVSRLRIEKWKTSSEQKDRLQSNAESIQRNISAALPGMLSAVRTTPGNVGAEFKLYRNVSALYDVFTSLTESAGAFGPKDDFREMAEQGQQLDALRRQLGDRVEQAADAQDAEVARLRQTQRAAAVAAPKKIIVDNGQPEKPVKKKGKKASSATAENGSKPQP